MDRSNSRTRLEKLTVPDIISFFPRLQFGWQMKKRELINKVLEFATEEELENALNFSGTNFVANSSYNVNMPASVQVCNIV